MSSIQYSSVMQHPPHGFVPIPPGTPVQTPIDKPMYGGGEVTRPDSKVVSSRGWTLAKLGLGGLAVVFGLVNVGLGAGLVEAQRPYPADYGYFDAELALPPAVFSVIWNAAEIVVFVLRARDPHGQRGIHPGANVGVHLIIWTVGAAAGGLIADNYVFDSLFDYWWFYDSIGDSPVADRTQGYAKYMTFQLALAVCLWPLVLVNFILFVRACVECHRRNMKRSLHKQQRRQQLAAMQWNQQPVQPYQQQPYQPYDQQYPPQQYPPQQYQQPPPPPQQPQQQPQQQPPQMYPSPTPVSVSGYPPPTELSSAKSPGQPVAIEMAGIPKYMEMPSTPAPQPVPSPVLSLSQQTVHRGGPQVFYEIGAQTPHVMHQ